MKVSGHHLPGNVVDNWFICLYYSHFTGETLFYHMIADKLSK